MARPEGEQVGEARRPETGRREGVAPERAEREEDIWVLEEVRDLGGAYDRPERRRRRPGPGRSEVVRPTVRDSGAASSRGRGKADEVALPRDVTEELAAAVGRERGHDLSERMEHAVRAYERDRYLEALRITGPLAERVPVSASVRELHGLVCYRLGRWREAATHLGAA